MQGTTGSSRYTQLNRCPPACHHLLHSLVQGEEHQHSSANSSQITAHRQQLTDSPKAQRQSCAGPLGFLYPEDSSMLNTNITKGSTWFFKSLGTHGSPLPSWSVVSGQREWITRCCRFYAVCFKWRHVLLYQGYLSLLLIIPQLIIPTLKIIMYLIVGQVWRTQGFILRFRKGISVNLRWIIAHQYTAFLFKENKSLHSHTHNVTKVDSIWHLMKPVFFRIFCCSMSPHFFSSFLCHHLSFPRLRVRRDPTSWSEQVSPTPTSPGRPSRVVIHGGVSPKPSSLGGWTTRSFPWGRLQSHQDCGDLWFSCGTSVSARHLLSAAKEFMGSNQVLLFIQRSVYYHLSFLTFL